MEGILACRDLTSSTAKGECDEYERFPGRFKAELTEAAGLRHTRANLIRQEPGAKGPRHVEPVEDETFVPLRGTMTLYLGDPPRATRDRGRLTVFVYGAPPQRGPADVRGSAV
jgi:uncharacterized cupin superfamily protein